MVGHIVIERLEALERRMSELEEYPLTLRAMVKSFEVLTDSNAGLQQYFRNMMKQQNEADAKIARLEKIAKHLGFE